MSAFARLAMMGMAWIALGAAGCASTASTAPAPSADSSATPSPPVASAPATPPPPTSSSRSFKLYFPRMVGSGGDDCAAREFVTRTLPVTDDPVTAVVTGLLRGPTDDELARGFSSPFLRSVSKPEAPPVAPQHLRVSVEAGVATVDFAEVVEPYLLQAICARESVTTTIEKTLLELEGIQSVRFSIDGTVIEEWDA